MKKVILFLFTAMLVATALEAMPLAGAGVQYAGASTGGPIVAALGGPQLIGNGTTHEYILNVSGGPAGEGNYSYTGFVQAKNTTGLSISPTTGTSAGGRFVINITAGTAAEIVTVLFNITAGSGNQQISANKTFLLTVVKPVIITVPVTNQGSSGVQNANVSLYINNKYIQSQNVTLAAGQTRNVTFDWLAYNYPAGGNVATVKISSSGQLFFGNGQIETSFTLYIPGNSANVIDNYIIIGCIAAGVLLFMIYFRKPKPRF